MKTILKLVILLALLVTLLLLLYRFLITQIAPWIIREKLPALVEVADIRFSLLPGYMTTGNITVANPDLSSTVPLLRAPGSVVRFNIKALLDKKILIESIKISQASVFFEKKPNYTLRIEGLDVLIEGAVYVGGKVKVQKLTARNGLGQLAYTRKNAAVQLESDNLNIAATDMVIGAGLITATQCLVDDIVLRYTRTEPKREPLAFEFIHATGDMRRVVIATQATAAQERFDTEVVLTGEINYEDEGLPNAHIGMYARTKPVRKTFPDSVGFVLVSGIELQPIRFLFPQGALALLGGDALDATVYSTVTGTKIDGEGYVDIVSGNSLAIELKGTVSKPKLAFKELVIDLSSYLKDKSIEKAFTISNAGAELGQTSVQTTVNVAKRSKRAVAFFGKRLFKTAREVAALDLFDAGKTVLGTAADTTKKTGAIALESGASVMRTTREGIDEVAGTTGKEEWRNLKKERWQASWDNARRIVGVMVDASKRNGDGLSDGAPR